MNWLTLSNDLYGTITLIVKWAVTGENLSSEFLTMSDTNLAVQLQKMAREMKIQINEVEGLYYLAVQLQKIAREMKIQIYEVEGLYYLGSKSRFSHDATQMRF